MSTYTGVTDFQKKQSGFFAHPAFTVECRLQRVLVLDDQNDIQNSLSILPRNCVHGCYCWTDSL